MTATVAYPGPGFLLGKGDGLGAYTTVGAVQDITALPVTVDIHEITNQSSPGGYEEHIPTIRRSGETAFDVIFDPSNPTHDEVTGLQADLNNKTLRDWQLIIPGTARKAQWKGYVVAFETKAPWNGVMTAAVKIKNVGAPTWVG